MTKQEKVAAFMKANDFEWNGETWQYKERFTMPVVHPSVATFHYVVKEGGQIVSHNVHNWLATLNYKEKQ